MLKAFEHFRFVPEALPLCLVQLLFLQFAPGNGYA
jgi:hypothetical protein